MPGNVTLAIAFAASALIAALLATPTDASECDSIKITMTARLRRRSQGQPSYCYSIRDTNERDRCLAKTKDEPTRCYGIDNPDARNACHREAKGESRAATASATPTSAACLATTRSEPSRCNSIEDPDDRNACLAEVKSERSYATRSRIRMIARPASPATSD